MLLYYFIQGNYLDLWLWLAKEEVQLILFSSFHELLIHQKIQISYLDLLLNSFIKFFFILKSINLNHQIQGSHYEDIVLFENPKNFYKFFFLIEQITLLMVFLKKFLDSLHSQTLHYLRLHSLILYIFMLNI